jgi:hypothetical protein
LISRQVQRKLKIDIIVTVPEREKAKSKHLPQVIEI